MKIVIRKVGTDELLYGNRTFTLEWDYARIFPSRKEANDHIDRWFDPATVVVEKFEGGE